MAFFMSESLNQLLNQFVQNSFKMFRTETNDFMSESLIFFYFSVFYSNSKTVINSETSDSNSELCTSQSRDIIKVG